MAEHPLDLAARFIDSGSADAPHNRITQELSELADDVALVESFSHVLVLRTGEGLVAFDASGRQSGSEVVEAIRGWSSEPVHTIVYTHGHLDHVSGSPAFAADADDRRQPRPRVLGHERVIDRMSRYSLTGGYNRIINMRQFGGAPVVDSDDEASSAFMLPDDVLWPDLTYHDHMVDTVGGVELHLHHARGETDDHTWTHVPDLGLVSAGDQFIWNFPNCGNPQKEPRFPLEWAQSLRQMIAVEPEMFVPAHGLPIAGKERIRGCLDIVATTLERLVGDVLDAMNSGATLDDIMHSVSVDPHLLELPYLRPLYDEPEFVVRNVWRLYGGWYDGTPSHLKPAPNSALAAEIAHLAGGADALVRRAQELATGGDLRLACHLIDFAAQCEPDSAETHVIRAEIYRMRRTTETSLMAQGIFGSAAAESEMVATGSAPQVHLNLAVGEQTL